MKDKARAFYRWFKEHPRLGSFITAIPIIVGILYLGEVIAAFLSGRSLVLSPWAEGRLDNAEGWIGLLIAGVAITALSVLVKYLFLRYFSKP